MKKLQLENHYPKAVIRKELGPGHGEMRPVGAILHYTAGSNVDSAVAALRAKSLGYHVIIGKDGTVHQLHPFNRVCWHCRGHLPNSHTSTNHNCIGIALDSFGRLEEKNGKFYAWSGQEMPNAKTPWDKSTRAQDKALGELLLWLVQCGMKPENIYGHHEINPRKSDPGGTILEMQIIRNSLKVYQGQIV